MCITWRESGRSFNTSTSIIGSDLLVLCEMVLVLCLFVVVVVIVVVVVDVVVVAVVVDVVLLLFFDRDFGLEISSAKARWTNWSD